MLSRTTTQLIQDVFGQLGDKQRKSAEKDPEACLVTLLTVIKQRLPVTGSTLIFTVEDATYKENIEEARRQLEDETVKG